MDVVVVPSAVRWATAVRAAVRVVPRAQLQAPARASLLAVAWTLAEAADVEDCVPAGLTAAMLACRAGVGDRVWQKRTALLRQWGWLAHGPGGKRDGWVLRSP